jgi:flagellar basal-body rod protein FlgG
MIQQFYISTSALGVYQRMMVNITNNIANAQTPGFKRSRVELESLFASALEEALQDWDSTTGEPTNKTKRRVSYGMGVKIADIRQDFREGQIQTTNKPLDLAIRGEGFFRFRMGDGTIAYGRAGNLQKDYQGYMTDPNGYVVDPPIRIPENTTTITIDENGRVFAAQNNEAQGKEVGQMLLARFENPSGLVPMGQNLYRETELSGEPILESAGTSIAGKISQYSLEFSNVNVIDELMQMVITQRSFELATKAILTGNDMLKAAEDIAKT